MTKNYIEIADLLYKQQAGQLLTSDEAAKLEAWRSASIQNNNLYQHITKQQFSNQKYEEYFRSGNASQAWRQIVRHTGFRSRTEILRRNIIRYAAIAILTIGSGSAWLLLNNPGADTPLLSADSTTGKNIPSSGEVVLTLSNGEQVIVSDGLHSMTEKNGTTIRNTGQQLIYNQTDTSHTAVYNTITVPRGGEYQLILSDGTMVWMNSESSLTFPVTFSGHSRELTLAGEAYFNVVKNIKKPFIVHTSQFDVRVTGTQFNIRTYPGDIPTAILAEGKIQLEKNQQLVAQLLPGEEAALTNGMVEVKKVNIEDAIAWRNNTFCFNKQTLESILNEIARWYDLDILYLNQNCRSLHFSARFSRSESIENVIYILEKTQKIKIKLKGKILTIKTTEHSY